MQWEEARPVPGHEAFNGADPVAIHSQAAFLLLLARQRLSHLFASQEVRSDHAMPDEIVAEDPEDEESLDIPEWADASVTDIGVARMRWSERRVPDSAAVPPMEASAVAGLVRALYDSPGTDAAVDLIQACLDAPNPLVRVAAAAAALHLDLRAQDLMADRMPLRANTPYTSEPLVRAAAAGPSATVDHPDHLVAPARRLPLPGRATEVLMRGVGHRDELVRDVAVSALEGAPFHLENQTAPVPGREEPPGHLDRRQTESPSAPNDRRKGRFSIVVHGTFARWAGWWRPGRVFPRFLRAQVVPNLYAGKRPFYWSGIYSHDAHRLGAGDLATWTSKHGPLDHVFAHSHGGTVAMMASQLGVKMHKLVLLSCPVHAPHVPAFDRIGKVVSVRTRLDLVILADGGRQRFRDSRIDEHVLPLWFTHKATRQPDVWRRHKIAAIL